MSGESEPKTMGELVVYVAKRRGISLEQARDHIDLLRARLREGEVF